MGRSTVARQQVLTRDPQSHGAAVTRPSRVARPCRAKGREQGALIRRNKTRPDGSIILHHKSESREAMMKEDGRGGKRLDVCQPAARAGEPREFMERSEELPPECKANGERWKMVGMKRC